MRDTLYSTSIKSVCLQMPTSTKLSVHTMSMNNEIISRSIVLAGDLVLMLLLSRCQNTAMLTWAITQGYCWGKSYDNFFKPFFVNEDSFRNMKEFEQDSEKSVTWLTLFNGKTFHPLQWRRNGRYGVSNYQPHDCLLNRLFRRKS